ATRTSAVDRTVAVLAPAEVRVARVCRRDGCTPEAVRQRMAAQADDEMLCRRADFTLVNIVEDELTAAVDDLDRRLRRPDKTEQP
ncbi:MAG: dephospho-CoA kinase, partial [Alistipes sp.]|nr:dephospho-CoA kinase [Alistipes sp.]